MKFLAHKPISLSVLHDKWEFSSFIAPTALSQNICIFNKWRQSRGSFWPNFRVSWKLLKHLKHENKTAVFLFLGNKSLLRGCPVSCVISWMQKRCDGMKGCPSHPGLSAACLSELPQHPQAAASLSLLSVLKIARSRACPVLLSLLLPAVLLHLEGWLISSKQLVEINSCRWTGCAELFWNDKDVAAEGAFGVEGLGGEAVRRNENKREAHETVRNAWFSLCSFPSPDRNAGQTMARSNNQDRLQDEGNLSVLYEPDFWLLFPQLQVLQRKVLWNITAPAFDKQEADQPGAKCIT